MPSGSYYKGLWALAKRKCPFPTEASCLLAQRSAKSGMPVMHEGRRVHAFPEELKRWLGRESAGEPVQIATETADLSSEIEAHTFVCSEAHTCPQ